MRAALDARQPAAARAREVAIGRLIYAALCSVDGYVADAKGNFDWAAPDEEVHALVNDLERPVGTHLYGRRMYEVLTAWETMPTDGEPDVIKDFAEIWRAAEKIVYSKTLAKVSSKRTRIERDFDPAAVRRMKAGLDADISIGGPQLAAEAFRSGLVDECHLLLAPVVVGNGNRALQDGLSVKLDLVDQRRFKSGFVHLHYRVLDH
jgi:dihydrofolate reductase